MLFHHLSHLKAKGLLPENRESFRFNSINRRDWSNFVMDPDSMALLNSTLDVTTQPHPNTGLADNYKTTYSQADSFKRSIKRDASIFTTFKDSKQWDTWRRNTVATARAQDVAEVLNPNYRAVTAEDKALFKEKQKFMYAVFDKTLQTDRGKKHVREHEEDFNAEGVYQKLSEFYTTSTNARVSASTTLSCITSAKIESWKGTTEAFILHWQDQIRLCDTLVPTDSHFSENQKRTMLENAVASVAPLRAIKDQHDQHFSHSGQELSYEQYSNLLLSAATNYGIQFSSSTTQSSRKVYVTESDNSNSFRDTIF
jgi:hypothetical protein